jgi:hypothetical protein
VWILVGPADRYGARSHAARRTDDNRCPLEQRGGERGRRVSSTRTRGRRRLKSARTFEDTSFARSRDPCTSIVIQLPKSPWSRKRAHCWIQMARRFGIAVGQTYASRRNRHRDRVVRTMRGSPRITARESERAWFVRKGRWSRPPSLRGDESSGLVARTSYAVAEVGKQHLGLE